MVNISYIVIYFELTSIKFIFVDAFKTVSTLNHSTVNLSYFHLLTHNVKFEKKPLTALTEMTLILSYLVLNNKFQGQNICVIYSNSSSVVVEASDRTVMRRTPKFVFFFTVILTVLQYHGKQLAWLHILEPIL